MYKIVIGERLLDGYNENDEYIEEYVDNYIVEKDGVEIISSHKPEEVLNDFVEYINKENSPL